VAARLDALVLGGGPAGLAFAALAARSGLRVLLVERSGYERPRPGEHLSGAIRPALAALGLPRAAAARVLEPSAGIVSDWGAPLPVTRSYGGMPGGPAFNADRLGFDRLLRDHACAAGAVCLERSRLVDADRSAGRWRVRLATPGGIREAEPDFVVDATGRRAAFARGQGARIDRAGDLAALVSWSAGPPDRPGAQPLVVAAGGSGWWSLAATPGGGWAASFYGPATLLDTADPPPPVVANRLGSARTLARAAFACCPQRARPMHGPGWIAIGEAAAAFDPICGRGVSYALETAFRAWEAVAAGDARPGRALEEMLDARLAEHLAARREVYAEAGGRLDPEFLARAVLPGLGAGRPDPLAAAG